MCRRARRLLYLIRQLQRSKERLLNRLMCIYRLLSPERSAEFDLPAPPGRSAGTVGYQGRALTRKQSSAGGSEPTAVELPGSSIGSKFAPMSRLKRIDLHVMAHRRPPHTAQMSGPCRPAPAARAVRSPV